MSAIVTIPNILGTNTREVEVPKGNGYTIDSEGRLIVRTSSYGDDIACFTQWRHIVIEPDRGPDGRFVKRGS